MDAALSAPDLAETIWVLIVYPVQMSLQSHSQTWTFEAVDYRALQDR